MNEQPQTHSVCLDSTNLSDSRILIITGLFHSFVFTRTHGVVVINSVVLDKA